VAVLYDPKHRSRVVLAGRPARPAVGFDGPPKGAGDRGSVDSIEATTTSDPELAALLDLEQAESGPGSTPAVPAGGSQARLDHLQQLADLHDRGVLTLRFSLATPAAVNAGRSGMPSPRSGTPVTPG
jgi:hypothetical protein